MKSNNILRHSAILSEEVCISLTILEILFTASLDCCAKSPISFATTEKPFPAWPARAASIEAFKEIKLV